MSLAPIVLFVYNRPRHTRDTVEYLLENPQAKNSDLFIFSDGAKNREDLKKVEEVRKYLSTISGFKSVTLSETKVNRGLAKALVEGITHVCNVRGRVIVLEDDIIVSPYFLEYMNSALDRYENDERVMHISGYMFPVRDAANLPETFFYRATSSWGWATWNRAWRYFEPDAKKLLEQIMHQGHRRNFDILGTMDFTRMLRLQAKGKINSWGICWYASTFLREGLCLYSSTSLVRNLGHDGSGTHCESSEDYETALADQRISHFPEEVAESRAALEAIAEFNRSLKKSLPQRMVRLAKRVLRKSGNI